MAPSRTAAWPRTARALCVALVVTVEVAYAAPPSHASAHPSAADASAATPLASAIPVGELDRMLAKLSAADFEERRAAAKAVGELGPQSVGAITQKLDALRSVTSPDVAASVRRAGNPGDGEDLCALLVRARGEGDGLPVAVQTAALLRALGNIGTTAAARQIVKVAGDHALVFRPEVERLLHVLGDKAVPALVETKATGLRRWGESQLEGMGKRIPGDAVQTKDNAVLADVLRAYAHVHEMDALPVILSFVNSDRVHVRAAAREAVAKYGQDAIWKLREAYGNVTGKSASDAWTAEDVARELFAAYDRLRLQEVYGVLEEGLAKHKQGQLDDAIAAFDKVLARQPMLDRRAEMVPAYVQYAQKLEETDAPTALAVYRKALRLAPDGPRAPRIEAEIAYLEGKELLARGIADSEPFKRALAHDPTHERARAELRRLEADAEEREASVRALAAAATVVVVALVGALLFGGRRRPRRARPAP